MKKILLTLLSITLSYSSFASLGPDAGVPSLEFGERIQVDAELNDKLQTVPGPVFLYSEQTDELFQVDKATGTAFKSSEEYQVALFPAILIGGALGLGSGLGLIVPYPAFLFGSNGCKIEADNCWCKGTCKLPFMD